MSKTGRKEQVMRTWTAKIEIGTDIFDADLSEANLKADQMKSAVLEAGRMLRELRSSLFR